MTERRGLFIAVALVDNSNWNFGVIFLSLFTIGYEGSTFPEFLLELKHRSIDLVLDVRQLPLSRKPGFSKKAFCEGLKISGIDYAHLPALGCPKLIRNKYKTDKNWSDYASQFLEHLDKNEDLVELIADASLGLNVCLVCFEADYKTCHRSFISEAADQISNLKTHHLLVKKRSLS